MIDSQYERVFTIMRRGGWFTLEQIAAQTRDIRPDGSEDPIPAISARIRDMRKAKHGGHTVNRKKFKKDDLDWSYELIVNPVAITVAANALQARKSKLPPDTTLDRARRRGVRLGFVVGEDGKFAIGAS